MAGKHVARNSAEQQQQEQYQDQRIGDLEQQQAPPQQPPAPAPAATPAPAASSPMVDQLNQLAALHQQGVLTDDEFAAAKAKLIGT
jgi:3-oxoacyl-ACP reductase-like protein